MSSRARPAGPARRAFRYEPQEDTWLLCDALLADAGYLAALEPILAVEIG